MCHCFHFTRGWMPRSCFPLLSSFKKLLMEIIRGSFTSYLHRQEINLHFSCFFPPILTGIHSIYCKWQWFNSKKNKIYAKISRSISIFCILKNWAMISIYMIAFQQFFSTLRDAASMHCVEKNMIIALKRSERSEKSEEGKSNEKKWKNLFYLHSFDN